MPPSHRRHLDDEPVVPALAAVLSHLPDELWHEGRVDAEIWDSALLDPARDIVSRTGKGVRARLVENCWTLAGGPTEQIPDLLAVAIELLHVGSLVIDDIEDDSNLRRGEPALHRRYGLPKALNTGNWLCFLSLACLSRLPLDPERRLALYEETSLALIRCHQGQALDISVSVAALPRADVYDLVLTTTTMKTGALMSLAAVMGARAADAPERVVQAIRTFGTQLGIGLQMLDDWSGVSSDHRRDKGLEDLGLRRPTWPWAWLAEDVDQLGYAELVRTAREASIEWELERLRERMRTRLTPVAPDRIRDHFDRSVSALRSTLDDFGDGEALEAIELEIEALTRAFG